jgi:hypothetical protein
MAAAGPAGQAGAGDRFYSRHGGHFPLDPPMALPEQINGAVRGSSRAAEVARIDRIADVFPAIRACWRPPTGASGPTGLQITVRLSFKRNGEVLGRPRVTYAGPGGDRDHRGRFAASIVSALRRCEPLPFSAGFGAAVAGRPFTFRFIDDRQI